MEWLKNKTVVIHMHGSPITIAKLSQRQTTNDHIRIKGTVSEIDSIGIRIKPDSGLTRSMTWASLDNYSITEIV